MNPEPTLETFARTSRVEVDGAIDLVRMARQAGDEARARELLAAALAVLTEVRPPSPLPKAEDVPHVEGWKVTPASGLGVIAIRVRLALSYASTLAELFPDDEEIAHGIAAAEKNIRAWIAAIKACDRQVN